MTKHHTKTKGDQGVGQVIANLLQKECQVAIPISEHLPFDLVAISPEGLLARLSVKYRAKKNGTVFVDMSSSWSNKAGCHVLKLDKSTIDAVAVYCPDTSTVYYVRSDAFEGDSLTLRIDEPKAAGKYRWAKDHTDPLSIFD